MERKPSPADEVLAQAAARAAKTDPVLSELDGVLDADPLYQQVCTSPVASPPLSPSSFAHTC